MATTAQYSFEHGIDHCGRDGIAPILHVGHKVTERDFVERDLSDVRGVVVSQRGLSTGTKWADLNLAYLFSQLRSIEYLLIWFDDSINLTDIGHLPALRHLEVDCPTVRGTLQGELLNLRSAQVRWSDKCTASLNAPNIDTLTLIRPLNDDLGIVGHLTSLASLDIHYSRSLRSLSGIEKLYLLEWLGIHGCSMLTDLNSIDEMPSPTQLVVGGCNKFCDAVGATRFRRLNKLSIYRGPKGVHEILLSGALAQRGCALDLRGVNAIQV
ncbi:MAG: hypothetical protein H6943_03735 [Zoogloeaceae bacterium]|nr:hypothetical protein [Zoogloeaceae bacterium]